MASSSEGKMRWSPCCCTCIRLKTPAGADFAHMGYANCCAAWGPNSSWTEKALRALLAFQGASCRVPSKR